VFSPDGKQIAFFWNGPDQNKIDAYVQMIGGDQPLRLTYSGTRRICCLSWSPDGQRISFARCDNDAGAVYTVPVLGGPERKLTDVTCMEFDLGIPQWTPDGKFLLLADRCVPNGPYGIVAFSLETGEKHCVTAPPSPNEVDAGFKLSPNGRMVAFLRNTTPGVDEIYIVPVARGTPRQLTSDGQRILAIMWAADGKRIIFLSRRGGFLSDRLRQVSVEGGEIKPETVYPHFGTLSPDGQRVAYPIFDRGEPYSVWRADMATPGGRVLQQKKILASAIYDAQPQSSSDGTKIAFLSARSGNGELWTSNADGSDPVQLTSFGGEM
jgi:Tol biopolymer transport system component